MSEAEKTQVLVVGGGPAGSTAAGLLARQSLSVTLLERERFPRYHIGESVLPSCLPILDLLGAREKIEKRGYQIKRGVNFRWGPDNWQLTFADLGDETAHAWQVVRSDFDEVLLQHARDTGVDVREDVTVREVQFSDGRPTAARWTGSSGSGLIEFDYLVDASGRSGLLAARHLGNRRYHEVFRNVAAWTYWSRAKSPASAPEGATGVFSMPDGWFWTIPLHDGTMSIGMVTSKQSFSERRGQLGGVEEVYHQAVRSCPAVAELLTDAEQTSAVRVEQDYSYTAETFSGPGYLIVGDAACFLDPLLSTGVHLATYSAMLAAAATGSVLRGEVEESAAWRFYEHVYKRAYERLLVLVSVFYQSYRGRDYHFYHAQRLTAAEQDRLHLHLAFLRIISGIEDLEDAKGAAYDLAVSKLGGNGEYPFKNMKSNEHNEPISPDNAVDGYYLSFGPTLGLRRVADAVPAAARPGTGGSGQSEEAAR